MKIYTEQQAEAARAVMIECNAVFEAAMDARPECWDGTRTDEEVAAELRYLEAQAIVYVYNNELRKAANMSRALCLTPDA
jgi:hypothetical protein